MKKVIFFILLVLAVYCSTPKQDGVSVGDIDKVPPIVSITSPDAGSFVNGYVNINVQASDDKSGVEKIEYYIDNVLVATRYSSPSNYTWNTNGKDGNHTIKVVAYDYSGNSAYALISVTANNSFYISTPKNGETVFGNYLLVSVFKSDSVTADTVKFYYDGSLIGEDTNLADGISIRWDTTSVANNTYTLKAEAYNGGSKVAEHSLSIEVSNHEGYKDPTFKSMYEVLDFGSNPGNLRMFMYVPSGMDSNPKGLIVVLHGCSQDARNMAIDMEWNEKAEEKKSFYVIYPQQKPENHVNVCFNWFNSANQMRGYGEPMSIYQMIEKMKNSYNIDPSKIYVTGFSAGGCMASVIGATYPDIVKGIGTIGGIAYKIATDVSSAGWAMDGQIDKSPAELANLVREGNNGYTGEYPSFIGFQGVNDNIVDKKNLQELMEQWTEINGITTRSPVDPCSSPGTYTYGSKVKTYCISGMGHAVPVTDATGKSSYVYLNSIDATTEMLNYWGF